MASCPGRDDELVVARLGVQGVNRVENETDVGGVLRGVSRGRGTLKFALDEIPPPPSIVTTVNRTASFDAKSGSATISGTLTCDADADFGFFDLSLRQRVGGVFIQGFGSTELACTGAPEAWSVIVVGG